MDTTEAIAREAARATFAALLTRGGHDEAAVQVLVQHLRPDAFVVDGHVDGVAIERLVARIALATPPVGRHLRAVPDHAGSAGEVGEVTA